jgi:transposase InsO family protein
MTAAMHGPSPRRPVSETSKVSYVARQQSPRKSLQISGQTIWSTASSPAARRICCGSLISPSTDPGGKGLLRGRARLVLPPRGRLAHRRVTNVVPGHERAEHVDQQPCVRAGPIDGHDRRLLRERHDGVVLGSHADRAVDRRKWKTRIERADAIFDYLEIFHNRQRRHISLGMLTPNEYERLHTTLSVA